MLSSALTTAEKCEHLSAVCADNQETLNYFKLYFCTFKESSVIWGLFCVLLIIILFKFICSTVDEFIAPGIVWLSKKLNLSESLAGVTLIAFANGAGDVLTAIVASGSSEGVSYNIGALYGAGFFVLTLVVAGTILSSPTKIVVEKSIIFRDIGFYILATVFTLYAAYTGEISKWNAFGFLGIYVLYVGVVLI